MSSMVIVLCGCAATTQDVIRWREERKIDRLIGALKSENLYVRREAILALGEIGDSKILDHLIIALRDGDPNIRRAAVISIGKINDKN